MDASYFVENKKTVVHVLTLSIGSGRPEQTE